MRGVTFAVVALAVGFAWFMVVMVVIELGVPVACGRLRASASPAMIAALAFGPGAVAAFFVLGVFVPA